MNALIEWRASMLTTFRSVVSRELVMTLTVTFEQSALSPKSSLSAAARFPDG